MSKQAGPYAIKPEMTGSDCWVVVGPHVYTHGMARHIAQQECDRFNTVFAAGAASTPAAPAVQAVIDAARMCVPKDETVHLVDLWGRLDALRAALDALASLSTGGDAEGGKDARV